ncbi:hypothetical protein SNEBB_010928 [Seison nebaliae]|nr:hypothetical protein SNEBB_010928 [Seison nebaliae]
MKIKTNLFHHLDEVLIRQSNINNSLSKVNLNDCEINFHSEKDIERLSHRYINGIKKKKIENERTKERISVNEFNSGILIEQTPLTTNSSSIQNKNDKISMEFQNDEIDEEDDFEDLFDDTTLDINTTNNGKIEETKSEILKENDTFILEENDQSEKRKKLCPSCHLEFDDSKRTVITAGKCGHEICLQCLWEKKSSVTGTICTVCVELEKKKKIEENKENLKEKPKNFIVIDDEDDDDILMIPDFQSKIRSHRKVDEIENEKGNESMQILGKNSDSAIKDLTVTQKHEFEHHDFPHDKRLMTEFYHTFGLKQFRQNQLASINAILLNKDVFILMPTGGGKSLCYQLPAVISQGVTVVVSPLKSLIMDQVQKLTSMGILAAHMLNSLSSMSSEMMTVTQVYSDLRKGKNGRQPDLKLLYCTPEKLQSSDSLREILRDLYKNKFLQRIVIDEAHCVSEWGHDFRPDYKLLGRLRDEFNETPITALTATATCRVRFDVLHQLKMKSYFEFIQSFNRVNLRYSVTEKSSSKNAIDMVIGLIKRKYVNDSGIVYCFSRKECETTANALSSAGIKALPYHAGLSDRERCDVQSKWIDDEEDACQVVCATIAFGMGIDKPDVRYVFHLSLPKSMEGYYQESGRSGRDGANADCTLFYSYADVKRIRSLITKDRSMNDPSVKTHLDNLYRIVRYCENVTDCRRSLQLEYFGEKFDRSLCESNRSTTCDNCRNRSSYKCIDVTEDAKQIIQCVMDMLGKQKNSITLIFLAEIIRGSMSKKIIDGQYNRISIHGKFSNYSKVDCERLLRKLILDGYLKEEISMTVHESCVAYIRLGPRANKLFDRSSPPQVLFSISAGSNKGKQSSEINMKSNDSMINRSINDNSPEDRIRQRAFADLLNTAKRLGKEKGKHYANVFSHQTLKELSTKLPTTQSEMLQVTGITEQKYKNFDGMSFLTITITYKRQIESMLKVQSRMAELRNDAVLLPRRSQQQQQQKQHTAFTLNKPLTEKKRENSNKRNRSEDFIPSTNQEYVDDEVVGNITSGWMDSRSTQKNSQGPKKKRRGNPNYFKKRRAFKK